MHFDIIIGLLLLAGLVYYFRQAGASQKNKKRIVDLLTVGVIIWVSPKISAYINKNPFEISGILIFAYGWGILIVEKFREGLKEKNNTQ